MPYEMSKREKDHYAEVLFNQTYDSLNDDQIDKLVMYYENEAEYLVSAMASKP